MLDLVSVVSFMECVPTRFFSQAADIYAAAVVYTLHIIWLSYNSLRFSSDVVSIHAAKVRLEGVVSMSGNFSVGHCLHSNIPLTDAFSVAPHR